MPGWFSTSQHVACHERDVARSHLCAQQTVIPRDECWGQRESNCTTWKENPPTYKKFGSHRFSTSKESTSHVLVELNLFSFCNISPYGKTFVFWRNLNKIFADTTAEGTYIYQHHNVSKHFCKRQNHREACHNCRKPKNAEAGLPNVMKTGPVFWLDPHNLFV